MFKNVTAVGRPDWPFNRQSRKRPQKEEGREGQDGGEEDADLGVPAVAVTGPPPEGRRDAVGAVLQPEQQPNVQRPQPELMAEGRIKGEG